MILVVDNYDSFTYNLVQYLGQSGADVNVVRNDRTSLEEIANLGPKGILLSPGPCTPNESGICLDILHAAVTAGSGSAFDIPIFGVCLGHQSIGFVAGSTVERASVTKHGKTSRIEHDGLGLLEGMPHPFEAIRYHSLVVRKQEVPDGFVATAWSQDDREIMGLRHTARPIEGVQFHPESVLTENGIRIVQNFVKQVSDR
jgi:anthranilate synthase/aminodeoxychorismate synthase-like glutamine amidotransferase